MVVRVHIVFHTMTVQMLRQCRHDPLFLNSTESLLVHSTLFTGPTNTMALVLPPGQGDGNFQYLNILCFWPDLVMWHHDGTDSFSLIWLQVINCSYVMWLDLVNSQKSIPNLFFLPFTFYLFLLNPSNPLSGYDVDKTN